MLGITVGAETLTASVTNFFTIKLVSRVPFIDYSGETMITTRSKLRFGIRSSQRILNIINVIEFSSTWLATHSPPI